MANDNVKQRIIDEVLDEGVICNAVMRAVTNGVKNPFKVEMMERDGASIQFKVIPQQGAPRYFKVRVSEAY